MSGLVRVRLRGVEKNVGAEFAAVYGLEVLDEPTQNPDGSARATTRAEGRPVLPRVSVAEAAEKRRRNRRRVFQPIITSPEPAGESIPPIEAAVSESATDSEENE